MNSLPIFINFWQCLSAILICLLWHHFPKKLYHTVKLARLHTTKFHSNFDQLTKSMMSPILHIEKLTPRMPNKLFVFVRRKRIWLKVTCAQGIKLDIIWYMYFLHVSMKCPILRIEKLTPPERITSHLYGESFYWFCCLSELAVE